jgi:hypothetical protein
MIQSVDGNARAPAEIERMNSSLKGINKLIDSDLEHLEE